MMIVGIFLLLVPFSARAMEGKEVRGNQRDILAAATLKKLVEELPNHAHSTESLISFAEKNKLPADIKQYPPFASPLDWLQKNFTRDELASFSLFRTNFGIATYEDARDHISEEDKMNALKCKAPQPSSPRDLPPERPSFCPTSPRSLACQAPAPAGSSFWGAAGILKALVSKTT